jgi:exopolysaccharide biosynthesis predicted pyruvyltransferase EpsI
MADTVKPVPWIETVVQTAVFSYGSPSVPENGDLAVTRAELAYFADVLAEWIYERINN